MWQHPPHGSRREALEYIDTGVATANTSLSRVYGQVPELAVVCKDETHYGSVRWNSQLWRRLLVIDTSSLSGQPLRIAIAETYAADSYFAVSVHKAGSVLLEKIVKDICAAGKRAIFDLEPQLFNQGVVLNDCPLELVLLLERPGYVFTGFRAPWLLPYVRQYRDATKLLLVRDPRDIAVSYYFSMARSHTVPKTGEAKQAILNLRAKAKDSDIVEFVLRGNVNPIFSNLTTFANQVKSLKSFKAFRYEDVIFDKARWCREIALTLGVPLPPEVTDQIASRHDIRPSEESPDQHIRQVTPGNYKKYLDERAVRHIEKRCELVFDLFNYFRDA